MWKIVNHYKVKRVLLYLVVVTLTLPNFEVYIAYSNEEQFEISALFEGSMVTIACVIATVWLALYGSVFVK